MLEPSLVRTVLDAALSTGADFAELFMEDRRDTSLVLQLNRLGNGQFRPHPRPRACACTWA